MGIPQIIQIRKHRHGYKPTIHYIKLISKDESWSKREYQFIKS